MQYRIFLIPASTGEVATHLQHRLHPTLVALVEVIRY